MGASFDHGEDGNLNLAREGGHSHRRIVHAADMTGREIERALLAAVHKDPNIFVFEHHFAIDLLTCQVCFSAGSIYEKNDACLIFSFMGDFFCQILFVCLLYAFFHLTVRHFQRIIKK